MTDQKLIHLFREPGVRNHCRRREMVKDTRLDINGKPPMGGEFPVARHPRAYIKNGAYYIQSAFGAKEYSREIAEDQICPACLLIEVTMRANNTKSVNTARCILKAAGKKIP